MAIKIIKNTLVDPINRTCDECGSEFEFTYDDIQRTTSMGIFGDMMSRRFVVCPVCKHECTFRGVKLEETIKSWETEQCDLSKKDEEEYGGDMTIKLEPGEKLEEITWKDDDSLWYLTRPMREDEEPETHVFKQSSAWGIFEGTVTIVEKE